MDRKESKPERVDLGHSEDFQGAKESPLRTHSKQVVGDDWRLELESKFSYFEMASVVNKLRKQAAKTSKWMRENRESYNGNGELRHHQGWMPALNRESNPKQLEIRSERIRLFAHENGFMHYLYGLSKSNVVPKINEKYLKLAVEAETKIVISSLMNEFYSDNPEDISLATLGDWYCYAPGCRTELIRNNKLLPLCQLGITKARYNQGYAISIGNLGKVFWDEVYYPIVTEIKTTN